MKCNSVEEKHNARLDREELEMAKVLAKRKTKKKKKPKSFVKPENARANLLEIEETLAEIEQLSVERAEMCGDEIHYLNVVSK